MLWSVAGPGGAFNPPEASVGTDGELSEDVPFWVRTSRPAARQCIACIPWRVDFLVSTLVDGATNRGRKLVNFELYLDWLAINRLTPPTTTRS